MAETIHDLIAAFARHGDTGDGGVRRLAGTPEDKAARDRLGEAFARRGLASFVDPVGNQFGIVTLAAGVREAVVVGSHLDSQPTGGRFDGTYGVLAGLLAAEAVAARAAECPGLARRNLAVANWTNEEGARFQPSLTGSSVFTGALPLAEALALSDGDGVTLGAALSAIGYRGTGVLPFEPVRYVELHVEQGGRLEDSATAIGVVEGAWAARKLSLVFKGAPSHTGPTPMARRRDALRAAARAIEVLYDRIERDAPDAMASAARMSVHPNSPNVVPSRVQVWFEIRHEDAGRTLALGEAFLSDVAGAVAPLGVTMEVAIDEQRAPSGFDPTGIALAEETARRLGLSVLRMKTVAGHDAVALQKTMPATLVFVPSQGGLSHTPEEFTAPADLDNGVALLTELVWRMVTEPS